MWECDGPSRSVGMLQQPDLAGVVPLIVVVGSAGVAVMGLLVQYLFFHNPLAVRPSSIPPNPVDAIFLWRFRAVLGLKLGSPNGPLHESALRVACDQYILTMGDVQLGMGLAVLIYGYASLFSGLSAYHWWLLIGLAWFSLITQLAALVYLRDYYARRPNQRAWRLMLLICFICVLAASMVPTARMKMALAQKPEKMEDILGRSAICYFANGNSKLGIQHGIGAALFPGVYVIVALLLVGLVFGLLKLYEIPGGLVSRWYRNYRGLMEEPAIGEHIACVRCEQRTRLLVVRPFLAFWLVLRMYADLLSSIGAEVFCILALTVWVTLRFVDIHNMGPSTASELWTLEHIAALMFCAMPFRAFADYLCGLWFDRRVQFRAMCSFSRLKWKRRGYEQLSEHDDQRKTNDDHASLDRFGEGDPTLSPTSQTQVSTVTGEVDVGKEVDDMLKTLKDSYSGPEYCFYINRPWLALALPVSAFSALVHVVLLMTMPRTRESVSPADALLLTAAWAVIYVPLLVFVYFLASMIVDDRIRPQRRRAVYGFASGMTLLMSLIGILDTLYGLGGTPMSYLAMGALCLLVAAYLVYGLVARLGRLVKGKGRAYAEDEDLEGGAGVTAPGRKRARVPARKARRFPCASQRLLKKGGPSYGTMGSPSTG
ncbi:Uu.00g128020.m01.CDS01 [Anthostomella pinea]|uniref:Uu.00g128020.m01.CDS01 n=1 Tax=Anthostomella pinea TaxID=933095 RepID=A0AAI8VI61_9PEZI|nr:Uu.00g128020.m01.CDS01 [Anthostomella pinea]